MFYVIVIEFEPFGGRIFQAHEDGGYAGFENLADAEAESGEIRAELADEFGEGAGFRVYVDTVKLVD